MHTYFSIKRHFVPVPKITAPQTKIYGQCTQTRYSTQLYVTFRCSRTTFFAPFFRSHFFFVGAACAAAVVVYLHCFSFRWIRYAHVQWPDIKFDGIFHRINALWDIANTHTQKTRTRFFFVCCCCFFLLCLCFANFPIFVRVWQDIRRKNYDKWELRSARNFQEELLKISKQSMIKSMNTNNTHNKL